MFQVFSVMGYGVTLVDLLMGLIFLVVIKQLMVDNRHLSVVDWKLVVPVLILIFAVYFSGIGLIMWGGRESLIQYFKTTTHFLFVALYGLVVISVEIDYRVIYKFLRTVVYVSFFINLYTIYQLIARIYGLPFAYIEITNESFLSRDFGREVGEYTQVVLNFENFYRATSIFSEPSALAWFNIYCLIIILIPLITHKKPIVESKLVSYAALLLVTISLFLTFSLSGLILLVVAFVSIIVIEKIKIARFAKVMALVVAILFVTDNIQSNFTSISVAELFYQRISGLLAGGTRGKQMTTGESAPDRIESMRNAVVLFMDYPITGIGSGNTYYYPESTKRYTQSSFFHILAENGIVGIVGLVLLIWQMLRIARNFVQNSERYRQLPAELYTLQSFAIYLAILIVFSLIFISNIIGNYVFWLEFGLIVIIYRQTLKESEKLSIEGTN